MKIIKEYEPHSIIPVNASPDEFVLTTDEHR
jgi:hypothetical protein